MTLSRPRPTLGSLAYFSLSLMVGIYFAFAAVQGDYGLLRRMEIDAERAQLRADLDRLSAEVARMENLTRRLSDTSLDLDLLDERAREVLGLIRPDEIVIR